MQIYVHPDSKESGRQASAAAAQWIRECIREKGHARIVLSTGASQFDFFDSFVREEIDWERVEMFHLDEYVGLPDTHHASFRKYLREKFVERTTVRKVHFIHGDTADHDAQLRELERLFAEERPDLGLIGIGENAHIAFNDPPADFETRSAYKILDLDEDCKRQQVREGWFPTLADVPAQAISMTVHGIMTCRKIISVVPHRVKATAIRRTLENDVTNLVPSTMLKTHEDWSLYLDKESAALLPDRPESDR